MNAAHKEADSPNALAYRMAGYNKDADYIARYVAREYHPRKTPTVEQVRAMQAEHKRIEDDFRRVAESYDPRYDAENDNGDPFKPAAIGIARPTRWKPVEVETVEQVIARAPSGKVKRILVLVAAEFGLTVDELRSRSRFRKIVAPRQLAMKLLSEVLNDKGERRFSLQQIAAYVGKDDHSTVAYGIETFPVRAKQYPALAEAYERIKARLG